MAMSSTLHDEPSDKLCCENQGSRAIRRLFSKETDRAAFFTTSSSRKPRKGWKNKSHAALIFLKSVCHAHFIPASSQRRTKLSQINLADFFVLFFSHLLFSVSSVSFATSLPVWSQMWRHLFPCCWQSS